MEAGLALLEEVADQLQGRHIQSLGDFHQLHDVDPARAALTFGNEPLCGAQPLGQFHLRQLRIVPVLAQDFQQQLVIRIEC